MKYSVRTSQPDLDTSGSFPRFTDAQLPLARPPLTPAQLKQVEQIAQASVNDAGLRFSIHQLLQCAKAVSK